jgi:hypothetical protein
MTEWRLESEWDDIWTALREATDRFLRRDEWLLEANVHERSITHKFAEHLQPLFEPWDVDCEYNRDGLDDAKSLPLDLWRQRIRGNDSDSVFPDIIVHRRNTNQNLLVIEAKKIGANNVDQDMRKLRAYMTHQPLAYVYGALLLLGTGMERSINIRRIISDVGHPAKPELEANS